MQETVNRREWRVVGMSRSGNHAILHWLLSQMPGRVCFLNCCEPGTNPFASARPMDHGGPIWTSYPDFDPAAERRGRFGRKDWLIHSYEDCFLGMLARPGAEDDRTAWLGPSAERRNLLILRDPFNLFASRIKSGYGAITTKTVVRMWKQHARECLRPRYFTSDCVPILYNRWVSEPDYRRRLAERLGLSFTDQGFNEVASCGGGSSFDGFAYAGAAHRMRVFDRWRHYADDPHYRAMLDKDVVRLSEALFGPIPGTETLFPRDAEPVAARASLD